MKCILLIILLQFFGIAVIKATLLCKDNETSAEYALSNTAPIKSFITKLFDEEMTQKLEHLYKRSESRFNNLMTTMEELGRWRNCREAMGRKNETAMYRLHLKSEGTDTVTVVCRRLYGDYDGRWAVVMRRFDGSVDFDRNWHDYKNGFGNLNGEFFIGLQNLYALTTDITNKQQLLIIMRTEHNDEIYAKYTKFGVSDEQNAYRLRELGTFTGNATDAMAYHYLVKFSTKDADNDQSSKSHCAKGLNGAWWFKDCHNSNLFGRYDDAAHGIEWLNLTSNEFVKLRSVEMLLSKPTKFMYI